MTLLLEKGVGDARNGSGLKNHFAGAARLAQPHCDFLDVNRGVPVACRESFRQRMRLNEVMTDIHRKLTKREIGRLTIRIGSLDHLLLRRHVDFSIATLEINEDPKGGDDEGEEIFHGLQSRLSLFNYQAVERNGLFLHRRS